MWADASTLCTGKDIFPIILTAHSNIQIQYRDYDNDMFAWSVGKIFVFVQSYSVAAVLQGSLWLPWYGERRVQAN